MPRRRACTGRSELILVQGEKKKRTKNTRALAAQLITEIVVEGRSLTQRLTHYKTQCSSAQDAAFFQSLVFGGIRYYFQLTAWADLLRQKPLPAEDKIIDVLICLGLYQLKFMRVPQHAALSETVEAVRILQKGRLTGLVNAVLRNFLREQTRIEAKAGQKPSAKYAHPDWLIKQLQQAWPKHWEKILLANNEQPPLTLRINRQNTNPGAYLKRLSEADIEAHMAQDADNLPAITLDNAQDVRALPGFEEGDFYAQDAAAQAAVPLLQLAPGQYILDVCAAPGGKTTHCLELVPDLAEIVAVDVSAERCERIRENVKRLKLSEPFLRIQIFDAADPKAWDPKYEQYFDRILADLPCSATGVIRRHPDIKLLRRESDIPEMAKQQRVILNNIWPLLKPGGVLVYTTCSILPQENEAVISEFLAKNTNAELLPIHSHELSVGISLPHGLQTLPGQAGRDGFYYARLKKVRS